MSTEILENESQNKEKRKANKEVALKKWRKLRKKKSFWIISVIALLLVIGLCVLL